MLVGHRRFRPAGRSVGRGARAQRLGNFRRLSIAVPQAGAPAAHRRTKHSRSGRGHAAQPGASRAAGPRAEAARTCARASDSSRSARRRIAGHESPQEGPEFMPVQQIMYRSVDRQTFCPPQSQAYSRRLTWLAIGALLWAGLIFAKLVSLQVIHHRDYARIARQQQELRVAIPAPRGPIFDRTGQPMAMSIPVESVFVNPLRIPDMGVASEILARILRLDAGELRNRMRSAYDHQRGFLWVKRKIPNAQAEQLRSLHLDWIDFETESQRHYPNGTLAAHVLGSVDHEEKGNAGVEMSLDR